MPRLRGITEKAKQDINQQETDALALLAASRNIIQDQAAGIDPKGRKAKALAAEVEGAAAKTFDSYQNFALKLGLGTDNALSGSTYGFNPVSRIRILLEWIHRGSWLGGIAVDTVADDMTRGGIDIHAITKPEELEVLNQEAMQMGVWPAINDSIKWARLYGGCVAAIMVEGQNPATPLREETIGKDSFRGLMVLDRWMIDQTLMDLISDYGPDFGLPRFYSTLMAPALPKLQIHHSRVIRLEGIRLPYQQRIAENLWGISVLERLYDRMVAFDSATQGAAQLVYKSYLREYKVENLREALAAGGKAERSIIKMVQMMARFQGIEGISMIDAKDDFGVKQVPNFAGIADILLQFGQQISGALQIPLVRLFGQSPAGLSASGESDLRMYYDGIKQQQEHQLRRGVNKIYRVMAKSKGIKLGDSFGFDFRPLWQLSDQQKAEVSERDTADVLAVDSAGLVSPQVSLRELRQRGRTTNRWTNITDEMINEADDAPRPTMTELMAEGGGGEEGESGDNPVGKPKLPKASAGERGDGGT